MGNALRGRTTLEVDGITYTLVPDVNALCELEELLSTPEKPVSFQEAIALAPTNMRYARALYWALLRAEHPAMTLADVGVWLTKASGAIEVALQAIVKASTPDPADVKALTKDRPRPRKAQADRRGGTGANSISTSAARA